MSNIYHLTTIHDLLKVPMDRREACMRDMLYALALHELAFGEQAIETGIGTMAWTDDGKHDISVSDTEGAPVLSMRVTDDAPEDLSRRDDQHDLREAEQYHAERAHDNKRRELNGY